MKIKILWYNRLQCISEYIANEEGTIFMEFDTVGFRMTTHDTFDAVYHMTDSLLLSLELTDNFMEYMTKNHLYEELFKAYPELLL